MAKEVTRPPDRRQPTGQYACALPSALIRWPAMRRCVFALLSAVSALICIGVMSLWIRSYVVEDHISFDEGNHGSRLVVFCSSRGRTWMAFGTLWSGELRRKGWSIRCSDPEPLVIWNDDQPLWKWCGIGGGRAASAVFDSYEIAVPHWLIVLPTAIPPCLWMHRRARIQRRRRLGLCLSCGYDLRASSDRCTECGRAFAGAPRPQA